MGKLSVKLSAALALLLLLALSCVAVAHRTTITTIEYEEQVSSDGAQVSCREQIHGQDLDHCEKYLASRRDRPERSTEEFEDGHFMHHMMQSCCHQLKRLDEQCRCQEIRRIVREQQQEYAGKEMEEIVLAARDLPSACEMAPRRCEIRAVWF